MLTTAEPATRPSRRVLFLRWCGFATVLTAAMLLIAGRVDLLSVWLYAGTWWAMGAYMALNVDPSLPRERMKPGGPGADPRLLLGIRLLSAVTIVVGLVDEGRIHWTDNVPSWIQAAGFVLMNAGSFVALRAMVENRFFSTAVRIQSERGHHVITTGPYAVVRHPGYLGMLISIPAGGLLLGSWLAFALSLVLSVALLRRCVVEDRFLHAHLPGYAEYARRVRFRLVPHVW